MAKVQGNMGRGLAHAGLQRDHGIGWLSQPRGDCRHLNKQGYSVTESLPNCWLMRRATRALRGVPSFGSTNAFASSDQSSLKLVVSADIQICRMGVFGVMTKRAPESSKRTLSTPFCSSTSKSPASSAASRDFFRDSRAASECLRKVFSSSIQG